MLGHIHSHPECMWPPGCGLDTPDRGSLKYKVQINANSTKDFRSERAASLYMIIWRKFDDFEGKEQQK